MAPDLYVVDHAPGPQALFLNDGLLKTFSRSA